VTDTLVGCDRWRALVNQYDWDVNIAMAVMEAESTCNIGATGDTWEIGGLTAPSCGLFQVRTLVGRPTCEELKVPETNVEWAYRIYTASVERGNNGWYPWSVYNNGKYLKYLER
jgi:hypothetical protein